MLTIHRPEGDEIERYEKIEEFRERLLTLERGSRTTTGVAPARRFSVPQAGPNRLPR